MAPLRRVEIFSDGVFAIAITLLVLELPFPKVGHGDLLRTLGDHWPRFANVISFVGIGVVWVHHHAIFEHVARLNRRLLLLNLVVLMAMAFLPFPTALLGDYVQDGRNARIAAFAYSGAWVVAGPARTPSPLDWQR